jgi:uncharacterized tellurite resistance protein B-like protein
MRPRDFIRTLEDPSLPPCAATGEGAEQLRRLLVHLFFIDRDLDKRELALLQRLLPTVDVRAYVSACAAKRLDLDRLTGLFPDAEDRNDIIALALHAAWGDDKLERRERDLLDRLADKLGVSRV